MLTVLLATGATVVLSGIALVGAGVIIVKLLASAKFKMYALPVTGLTAT